MSDSVGHCLRTGELCDFVTQLQWRTALQVCPISSDNGKLTFSPSTSGALLAKSG